MWWVWEKKFNFLNYFEQIIETEEFILHGTLT